MKIIVDMNLSPLWVPLLTTGGYDAQHWSQVGAANAPDAIILAWAVTNNAIVLTHDLDFGTLLAHTHAARPSVIQVRTQDVLPQTLGSLVLDALAAYEPLLITGALIIIDAQKVRARILPLHR